MLSEAYGREAMRKSSVSEWHKQPKKARMSESQMKTVLPIFCVIDDTVHCEFHFTRLDSQLNLLCGNIKLLHESFESLHRKRPDLWSNNWILYHGNAQVNKVLPVKQFLVQKSITEMQCPFCSVDFVPNDFWLFPEIKSTLKGQRFQDTEGIQKKM
jgi:hypothetical protein